MGCFLLFLLKSIDSRIVLWFNVVIKYCRFKDN